MSKHIVQIDLSDVDLTVIKHLSLLRILNTAEEVVCDSQHQKAHLSQDDIPAVKYIADRIWKACREALEIIEDEKSDYTGHIEALGRAVFPMSAREFGDDGQHIIYTGIFHPDWDGDE